MQRVSGQLDLVLELEQLPVALTYVLFRLEETVPVRFGLEETAPFGLEGLEEETVRFGLEGGLCRSDYRDFSN